MKHFYSAILLILMTAFICSLLPAAGNSSQTAMAAHDDHEVSGQVIGIEGVYDSGASGITCLDFTDVQKGLNPGRPANSADRTGYFPLAIPFDVFADVAGSKHGPSCEDAPRNFAKSDRDTGIIANRLLSDRTALITEKNRLESIQKILFPWHSFL